MASYNMHIVVLAFLLAIIFTSASSLTIVDEQGDIPTLDPITKLTQCLTGCGIRSTSCVVGCTNQGLQMPICVTNCVQANVRCLFSCVRIPVPSPPMATVLTKNMYWFKFRVGFHSFSSAFKKAISTALCSVVQAFCREEEQTSKVAKRRRDRFEQLRSKSVTCFDQFMNSIPFSSLPIVKIKVSTKDFLVANIDKMKVALSSNQLFVEIADILFESSKLDVIRPCYEAALEVYSLEDVLIVEIPCRGCSNF
ncbi:uncharacterized protein A4U43_C02F13920 [Asparagus officinalis]|uniref:Uncharacterized protein n=1 Tax=Asparagus officinalis TaxID=4686 RepID=A0A5P1FKW9_ASPOF|nr:uncharacterized protein A4U43_C02F13920 [Asparagus officinalis]